MTAGRYASVAFPGGRATVNQPSKEFLGRVDAVVFDCDGVLIDARRSYDATIRVVAEEMVRELTGSRIGLRGAAPGLISQIRRTGGFNNDWDTTYALTLFSVTALGSCRTAGSGRAARSLALLGRLVERFCSRPRLKGQRAVDEFLEKDCPPAAADLKRAREYLGYPGTPPLSRMATAFDETYFGKSLFTELFGVRARGQHEEGLIDLERPLVREKTLQSLTRLVEGKRLAMVTGRPFLGTKYSLGKLMEYFDREASIFIGDADVYPELAAEYEKYRKPSGEALLRAGERLSSRVLLYVGDSAEDLLMVRDVKDRCDDVLFAGVYQTAADPEGQISYFKKAGSDVIVRSADQIPYLLEVARN